MINVIFAGVGGQGVILASKILMEVAKNKGFGVKESEVHGMAQRGGSVDCNVRYGDKVYSPLIPKGGADYVVCLELLESMRKLEYLAPNGTLIVNLEQIDPAPVTTGAMKYPSDLQEWIKTNVKNHKIIDAEKLVKEVGSRKAVNIIMLGVLSKHLEFTLAEWETAIRNMVKEKFFEMNMKAFNAGRSL